jgi:hypothetical protein
MPRHKSPSRPEGGYTSLLDTGPSDEPFKIASALLSTVIDRMEERVSEQATLYRQLREVMIRADFQRTREEARRRLQNPRLRTTYVAERYRALCATQIDLVEEIYKTLPQLILFILEQELVEAELAAVTDFGIRSLNTRASADAPFKDGLDIASLVVERVERRMSKHENLYREFGEWGHRRDLQSERRRLPPSWRGTTSAADRRKAATSTRLDLEKKIAGELLEVVGLSLELELVEAELHAVRERILELQADCSVHQRTGLYADAVAAVNRLYDVYGVYAGHWSRATVEELAQIAKILRRE